MEYLPPFEKALNDLVNSTSTVFVEPGLELPVYYIALEGSFGENLISPRSLNSSHLGMMISLEAIVTRCKYIE